MVLRWYGWVLDTLMLAMLTIKMRLVSRVSSPLLLMVLLMLLLMRLLVLLLMLLLVLLISFIKVCLVRMLGRSIWRDLLVLIKSF